MRTSAPDPRPNLFKKGDPRTIAIARLGGRPKGSLSKAKLLWRDLAERILTDIHVQRRMLEDAQAGTLHPAIVVELARHYAGRPPLTVIRVDPQKARELQSRADLVDAIRQLSPADRRSYYELNKKLAGEPVPLPLPVSAEPRVVGMSSTYQAPVPQASAGSTPQAPPEGVSAQAPRPPAPVSGAPSPALLARTGPPPAPARQPNPFQAPEPHPWRDQGHRAECQRCRKRWREEQAPARSDDPAKLERRDDGPGMRCQACGRVMPASFCKEHDRPTACPRYGDRPRGWLPA